MHGQTLFLSSQLKTPNRQTAGDTDRVMLLAEWCSVLQNKLGESKKIIAAGMGRPTFPVHPDLLSSMIEETQKVRDKAIKARGYLEEEGDHSPEQIRISFGKQKAVIGYDNPQGRLSARTEAAKALSNWYGNVKIDPENILFNTGGAGALFNIFTWLHQKNSNGYIVTPFPYYSLYASSNYRMNNLHPVHVMQEPGYKLSAKALAASIEETKKNGLSINAFLFCDPNNPLGTVVSKEEWEEIAKVLKTVPEVPVIFDGAYAEMVLNPEKRTSLLEVADDDLRKRIILLRSGTKALSVPGLRMALTVCFDPEILTRLLQTNIDTSGHPATIMQDAFAKMLHHLNEPQEINNFVNHYKPQVELVYEQLKAMGAAMPDLNYKPEGTFYVIGDFSDLLGTELCEDAYPAVGKKPTIETDEDLCYDLLFRNKVMIAPLSYYGLNGKKQAFMRITCSGGDNELKELLEILAERLIIARKHKIGGLLKETSQLVKEFQQISPFNSTLNLIETQITQIKNKQYSENDKNAYALKAKESLLQLRSIKLSLQEQLTQKNSTSHLGHQEKQNTAVTKIQRAYRAFKLKSATNDFNKEWKKFLEKKFPSSKAEILNHNPKKRLDYLECGWRNHVLTVPNPILHRCGAPKSK